jgi:hypothetical protein
MPFGGRGGRYYRPHDRGGRGERFEALGETLTESREPQATAADQQHDKDADMWRFIGDVAPAALGGLGAVGGGIAGGVVGGPLGAIGGATAGGQLGYGLGQMGGQAAGSYADSLTAPREDQMANYQAEEQSKADRKSALLRALMSMR